MTDNPQPPTSDEIKKSAESQKPGEHHLSERQATRADSRQQKSDVSDKGKPMLQRSERQATGSDNQAKSPSDVPDKSQLQVSDRRATRTDNQQKQVSEKPGADRSQSSFVEDAQKAGDGLLGAQSQILKEDVGMTTFGQIARAPEAITKLGSSEGRKQLGEAVVEKLEGPLGVAVGKFLERRNKGDSTSDAAMQGVEAGISQLPFAKPAEELDKTVRSVQRGDIAGAVEHGTLMTHSYGKEVVEHTLAFEGAAEAGGVKSAAGEAASAEERAAQATKTASEGGKVAPADAEPDFVRAVKEGKIDPAITKKLAIESWEKGGGNQLVKVVSPERGATPTVAGWVGELKFVEGRTPAEMEKILGLPKGELANGAIIQRLDQIPKAEQFEPRGYTQRPGGAEFNPKAPKYPPGLGAPQWIVTEPIPATKIGEVKPGEVFRSTRPK